MAEDFPAFGGILHLAQLFQRLGQFDKDHGSELAGDVVAIGERPFLAQFVNVFDDILPSSDAVASGCPVGKAAFAPFGDILGADGFAGELLGDNFLGFGQGVEPGEDVNGRAPSVRRRFNSSRMC